MVQTLAALLSWIVVLAIIAIAFLIAGLWRPDVRSANSILMHSSVTRPRQRRPR